MDLDTMKGVETPFVEWQLTEVLDDIIFIQFVDTTDDGDYINRNGVLVKIDPTKMLWRVGKVIKCGPKCNDKIKPGVHVLTPNDRGIQIKEVCGMKNVAFINEDRIFGLCEFTNKSTKRKQK